MWHLNNTYLGSSAYYLRCYNDFLKPFGDELNLLLKYVLLSLMQLPGSAGFHSAGKHSEGGKCLVQKHTIFTLVVAGVSKRKNDFPRI